MAFSFGILGGSNEQGSRFWLSGFLETSAANSASAIPLQSSYRKGQRSSRLSQKCAFPSEVSARVMASSTSHARRHRAR